MTGNAGDTLVVVELPFGSFTPGQPPADIRVDATVSNLADLGAPMTIQTRSGFRYGEDALDNPTAPDPSIVSDSQTDVSSAGPGWAQTMDITPTLITIEKDYLGAEDETVTGPNYVRQYQITVDVADGQTISNLDVIDSLPNNIFVTSIDSVTVGGAAPAYSDNLGSLIQPGNDQDLTVTLTNPVVGGTTTSDVVVTISFHVPEVDADGTRIIPINGEDDTTSTPDSRSHNSVRTVGDWSAIDVRDGIGMDNAVADPAGVTNTADISWTSLPGDETTPRSTHSTVSTKRTGDTANPGTTENDYLNSDNAIVDFPITPTKAIVTSSESHTGDGTADTAGDPRHFIHNGHVD